MGFLRTLKDAWREVEVAYNQGYLVNESMMSFVLYRAILTLRPDLHITYDARIGLKKNYRPDFVVWQDNRRPKVLFACELMFKEEPFPNYRWDIEKLRTINRRQFFDVLKRDPETGSIETFRAKKSQKFGMGFFAIANHDVAVKVQNDVTEKLTPEEQSIFCFAIGSILGKSGSRAGFSYIAPNFSYIAPK